MDSLHELWCRFALRLVFRFGLRLSLRFVGFGLRLRLAVDSIFPNFSLSLLPVLSCCTVVVVSLFVEFVSPLSDLRPQF